jgi:hypothetical protein
MRGNAEQTILKRFAEAGVHGKSDDQSGDTGGDAEHAERGDKTKDRGAIG